MLTCIRFAIAVAILTSTYCSASIFAQAPLGPVNRPPVSPYLNLLRGGNPAFLNYYGLVRPQLDAQNSLQSLQGQVQSLNSAQNSIGVDGLAIPVTGQTFGYFNHRSYFLNNRGGSGGGGGGGGGGGNISGNSTGVGNNFGNRPAAQNPGMGRPQTGGFGR